MTVLVTGGTGFVGSAIVRALLTCGESVRVMVREQSDQTLLGGLDVERVHGDLDDALSLERAVAGCRALFHAAADYRLWVPDPAAIYRTNVEGTIDLMHAAAEAGVERIVYTSSVATLGLSGSAEPADEETPTSIKKMVGHYKRSKYLAEQEVLRLIAEEGLPAVIVNPSAPIGPRDIRPTPTGRLVLDVARRRLPAYVDTGLNVVHVDDVADGHLLAFLRGRIGERYILGGENLPLDAIVKAAARAAGVRPPFLKLPILPLMPIAFATEAIWRRRGRTDEPFITVDGLRMARKLMFFSSAKAERELGYQARPAAEAFKDAIAWYRSNKLVV
ncbi:MAG: NAD-dependent epimerase/dehydratase family protein [Alphaproteobacteria bacterium]